MNGVIKKKTDKGFGFILGNDKKEYFFHRSQLKNAKFDELQENLKVEFEDAITDRGPNAEQIYVR